MRTIKFRVKKVGEDKWSYYTLGDLVSMLERQGEEYQSDTWCEFTGLLDKNGKEIYEGDVVQETKPYGDFKHPIRWSTENGGFWVGTSCPLNAGESDICEVIGNIYENPELVQSVENKETKE